MNFDITMPQKHGQQLRKTMVLTYDTLSILDRNWIICFKSVFNWRPVRDVPDFAAELFERHREEILAMCIAEKLSV